MLPRATLLSPICVHRMSLAAHPPPLQSKILATTHFGVFQRSRSVSNQTWITGRLWAFGGRKMALTDKNSTDDGWTMVEMIQIFHVLHPGHHAHQLFSAAQTDRNWLQERDDQRKSFPGLNWIQRYVTLRSRVISTTLLNVFLQICNWQKTFLQRLLTFRSSRGKRSNWHTIELNPSSETIVHSLGWPGTMWITRKLWTYTHHKQKNGRRRLIDPKTGWVVVVEISVRFELGWAGRAEATGRLPDQPLFGALLSQSSLWTWILDGFFVDSSNFYLKL